MIAASDYSTVHTSGPTARAGAIASGDLRMPIGRFVIPVSVSVSDLPFEEVTLRKPEGNMPRPPSRRNRLSGSNCAPCAQNSVITDDSTAEHDESDDLEQRDVVQRVARLGDDVSLPVRFDAADFVLNTRERCAVDRSHDDGVHRCNARSDRCRSLPSGVFAREDPV